MLTLIIIFGGIIILFAVILTTKKEKNSPKSHHKKSGNFWTCGEKGCKNNEYGEFKSKKDCETVCKSFVDEGFGCKLTNGVPWNSYSSFNTCNKHSRYKN